MGIKKLISIFCLFILLLCGLISCSNGTCNTTTILAVELNPSDGGVYNGESNVSLTPLIVLSFSAPMNPASINSQTVFLSTESTAQEQRISLTGNSNSIVPIGQIVPSNNNMVFTFSSATKLAQNTKYYVTITNQAQSSSGLFINQTQFNFTTGIFDYPMVSSISPANGESNVALESSVIVMFNESVFNVNSDNLELHAVNTIDNIIPSTISTLGNNTYQITPATLLNYSTTYYVVLKSGIVNSESTPLEPQSFNFSTITMPSGDIWMSGSKDLNQIGTYGTLGIPDVNNIPGAREAGASWVDKKGNMWLFGGESDNYLNDVWRYNQYTKEWTWVKGSNLANQSGIYGTKNTPSEINTPGARSGAMPWTDTQGNFWLFGGYGYDSVGTLGYLNDLWKFDPVTLKWTWVSGSNIANQFANYGIEGIESSGNIPGSRDSSATWVDNDGNFWLFGGCIAIDASACNRINDLWKYNISSNQWVWIGGSNVTNQAANYGIKGFESAGNIPSARDGSITWVDNSGNFWLFGGYSNEVWNDLWRFNTSTQMWTWVSGSEYSESSGVYGTKGVSSPLNMPGAREDGSGWVDTNGNLWLFGGLGYATQSYPNQPAYLNDLWVIKP